MESSTKCVIIFAVLWGSADASGQVLCFPKDFVFGVATASYQIEGAWNVSDKGESIWDRYTHSHPDRIFDHNSGDVAADSYHQFREDVRLLRELGVQYYRFSISWPRILPDGLSNKVSKDGVRYYNDLINELIKNDIHPMVTMYHWDLPQVLQDLGGWTNPIIADYYVDYARVLFETFGDRVEVWTTFNEPYSFCHEGYGGDEAPGGRSSGFEDYLCVHNVLRAHGMTYRMYQQLFKPRYLGSVSITLDFAWLEPATASPADQEAAERSRQFMFGWFAHPILSRDGDYPPIMRQRIDDISRKQNYSRSRLPTFTQKEIEDIKGSYDFLGLNHYTTYLVADMDGPIDKHPSYEADMGVKTSQKAEWPKSNSTWLRVVPWGFRKTLNWIKTNYNNPPTVITENGISSVPGLNDTRRIAYIDAYLRALHTAIAKDGCNVLGYTYWSLIDNFEWTRGYSERFGLYEVDYRSPQRTRTPRLSARYVAAVARSRCLPAMRNVFRPTVSSSKV